MRLNSMVAHCSRLGPWAVPGRKAARLPPATASAGASDAVASSSVTARAENPRRLRPQRDEVVAAIRSSEAALLAGALVTVDESRAKVRILPITSRTDPSVGLWSTTTYALHDVITYEFHNAITYDSRSANACEWPRRAHNHG